jgi:hypothetical protein
MEKKLYTLLLNERIKKKYTAFQKQLKLFCDGPLMQHSNMSYEV